MTIKLFPVYVCTKGRAGNSSTLTALGEEKIPHYIVVEPQEALAYQEHLTETGALLCLAENDRGLPYSRQSVCDHALAQGYGWVWVLDDDITGFFTTQAGKNLKVCAREALSNAECYFTQAEDIAQAGLEYAQFAWSATKPYVFNSYCDVAVAIHVQRCRRVKYQLDLPLKGDRDFTLQVLAAGYRVMKVCRWSFAAPKNGSNKGGLNFLYGQAGVELAEAQQMAERWPGICQVVLKKDGRHDVKINWRAFSGGL